MMRTLIGELLGYVLVCMAAVVSYFVCSAFGPSGFIFAQIPAMMLGLMPSVLLVAFPGFCLLRTGLSLLRRRDWVSFTLAGILNAVAISVIAFETSPIEIIRKSFLVIGNFFLGWNLATLAAGVVAGLTVWLVEKSVLKFATKQHGQGSVN